MSATTINHAERVQELVGTLRGSQLRELDAALAENAEGVVRLADEIARNPRLNCPPVVLLTALRKGEHRRKVRSMSTDAGGTGHDRTLIPAADALRRLYDSKLDELTRYGLPERERIPIAVDYACGEVWRCQIQPMPDGGIVRLEDDLYRAIGFDRSTGMRFPATS